MDGVRSSKGMVLEFRHRRADGSIRDVEVFSRSIEIRRKVFLYSIIHDITERKRAEEALRESEAGYRAVYEGAAEGMFQTSTAGRILAANDSLARILGYDSAEEVVEMVVDIARQVWVNADERAAFIRRVEQQGVVRQHECQFVRKDGEKIWVSLNGKLIRGPDGEVAYFQEFAEDISERKHAEEKVKATHLNMRNLAAHLLRSREEERRAVAQEVHDQVGQQLAALKMDLYWLGKHIPGTSASLGQRVTGMIDLCEEAISEVQRIAADLRPRMLDDLGLAPALQQLGADFTRHTGIPCTVSTSFPARLVGGNAATALYRLTQEALAIVRRHSQAHHAGVRLSLEKADLVLQIKDDGKGITCEQAEAPDSYGLIGLRERVAGLGGRLSIQGQPGKGSILTMRIPIPKEGGLA